ncbi:MAG TPA: hypothetical protein VNO74_10240, partial [Methylomirabilota bacterium]|nr:hypothetical protein [Methylomirabilota bacterium]
PFDYGVAPYVEHDIGSASYGTFFGLNGSGTVASKVVALATPIFTCGRWSINLQATGLNLSSITDPLHVALFINDSDLDGDGDTGAACFDVTAQIGNGIVKPYFGVHKTRHK